MKIWSALSAAHTAGLILFLHAPAMPEIVIPSSEPLTIDYVTIAFRDQSPEDSTFQSFNRNTVLLLWVGSCRLQRLI